MAVIYMYIDYVYGLGAMHMYVDCVYGCHMHAYWSCIWVLCTYISIVYIGATFMYMWLYLHVYWLCIWVVYTCTKMYIDCVYECYADVYWFCIWMSYTCILIVYMSAIWIHVYGCYKYKLCIWVLCMYIDDVYGCYIRVSWLCIWVMCTCILIVYMGALYMYVDYVYGCYMYVYWLCIWVLYTCILMVYTSGIYSIFIMYIGAIYMYIDCVYGSYILVYWLYIWMLCTYILIVYIGAMYMYIYCVYGCYSLRQNLIPDRRTTNGSFLLWLTMYYYALFVKHWSLGTISVNQLSKSRSCYLYQH